MNGDWVDYGTLKTVYEAHALAENPRLGVELSSASSEGASSPCPARLVGVVAVAAIFAYNSFYQVEPNERGVVLRLDAEAARRLPEPSENPATVEADPDDTAPDDLEDKLKRAWQYVSGNY